MPDETDEQNPDESAAAAEAAALVWEESRRQIVRQEADVDGLRTRAVALLSVSSLVAGLFGGHVLSHGAGRPAVIAALASFAGSVVAVLVVLAPRWHWEFEQILEEYIERLTTKTLSPLEASLGLARTVELSRTRNKKQIGTLYWWFFAACILTGLEVIFWGLSIL
jgi:hypothetical protein